MKGKERRRFGPFEPSEKVGKKKSGTETTENHKEDLEYFKKEEEERNSQVTEISRIFQREHT